MAWKTIGNHSYYYRSRREGKRVVSDYVGTGKKGAVFALIVRDARIERDEPRAEREAAKCEEREIAAWFDRIEGLATGAMVAAGFHKHHGQWRRNGRGELEQREEIQAPGGKAQDSGNAARSAGKTDVA
jgi:hypothetical protein